MIKSAPRGSTDVFQGFGNKVLALQICLYWAAVLIPTLIALKHLMPVSSMWPKGPLLGIVVSHTMFFGCGCVKTQWWVFWPENQLASAFYLLECCVTMAGVKLLNIVGSTSLFSPTTSLFLFNETIINNVEPTMLDNFTAA